MKLLNNNEIVCRIRDNVVGRIYIGLFQLKNINKCMK
jgi:hypothetical protein